MFGHAYFGPHYWGAHYFGPTAAAVVVDTAIEPLIHGGPVDGFLDRQVAAGVASELAVLLGNGGDGFLDRPSPAGTASEPSVTLGDARGGFLRRRLGHLTVTPRRRPQ